MQFGKLKALRKVGKRGTSAVWLCSCECGNSAEVTSTSLKQGYTRSCGCLRDRELAGQVFGWLTVIEQSESKVGNRKSWQCKCLCGNYKVISQNDLISSHRKSCGCSLTRRGKDSPHFRGHEGITQSFFNSVRQSAKKRNIAFNLTIQQLWESFLAQNKKCAFSGETLVFSTVYAKRDGTASVDRIDSSKGYTIDNIQWIHKDLNRMKGILTDLQFIEWCVKVSNHRGDI